MANLTNADRDAVIGTALKATFEPRFHALRKRMNDHLKQRQQQEHPRFIQLASDPEALKYLQYHSGTRFCIRTDKGGTNTGMPGIWSEPFRKPEPYKNDQNTRDLISEDVLVTSKIGSSFVILDAGIIADYHQVWDDLTAARSKLSELLHSYRIREKFAEAFPDLAKHLPPTRTPNRLPAVIVDDVRANLAALGIAA